MEILHSDGNGQQATYLSDVCQHFVGKKVVVFTAGHTPLSGILKDYNGWVLHLVNEYGMANTYIPLDKVVAFSGD